MFVVCTCWRQILLEDAIAVILSISVCYVAHSVLQNILLSFLKGLFILLADIKMHFKICQPTDVSEYEGNS